MKNIILTATLLGLLTGASFAQRGRAPMGTNRVEPFSHIGESPAVVRPNAGTMAPTAAGRSAVTTRPSVGTATPSSNGQAGRILPPNPNNPMVPPGLVVGPNVGPDKQHER